MNTTRKELRNTVIYQIFTRNYKGGTFKDIEEDLGRIKALGVDYIYLLPIHPSGVKNRKGSMGSPYAISDYRAVDPVQGTLQDFISLTEAAHNIGLKVMIDVVYNHTSPDSELSKAHPEWFYHKADGNFGNRIGDWWDVIDLDYSNLELWDYQIETLKMWAKYVDGFRCDVAPMVPLDFWKKAVKEVAEVCPDCLWLAEAVEPEFIRMNREAGVATSTDGELYQTFDICYDYDIYKYMAGSMTGKSSLAEYVEHVNLQELIYPENYIKLRCLENHDRPRAASLIPNEKVLANWTAWNYFAKGCVMIYAGQEYEVLHHPTLFDLDTVNFHTGKDISSLLSKLSEIKKEHIFADSSFYATTIGINDEVIYAIHKKLGNNQDTSKTIGFFSSTGRAQALHTNLPDGVYTNLINGEKFDVFEGVFAFDGNPIITVIQ